MHPLDELEKRKKIIIPKTDLHPNIRNMSYTERLNIFRAINGVTGGANIVSFLNANYSNSSFAYLVFLFGLHVKSKITKDSREAFKFMTNSFAKGLINPALVGDGKYPDWFFKKDFMSKLGETHPIFYVDLKGNLVFVKESRSESIRYELQQSITKKAFGVKFDLNLVKIFGLQPWLWRGYLRPPVVPEKIKSLVAHRLMRALKRRRTAPALMKTNFRGLNGRHKMI